ncbi:hypothetical protein B566_EDAN006748 [Ephemera danica]|nr:hypothetical protein B566_EDAN006748 [Ephemera danica]
MHKNLHHLGHSKLVSAMGNERTIIVFFGSLLVVCFYGVLAQYEWQPRDAVDEVRLRMDKVTRDNCPIAHLGDLYLPEDSVSHLPNIKDVDINPVFPNRTALLLLHNIALSRAFFFSYTLQSRFIRPAINDTYDPGMMYYFLSTVADVAANPHINASAIYFAPNSSYTPSYRGADDFNDPIHLERISTLNTFTVQDLGAIPNGSLSLDYTSGYYRINEWYRQWLPDNVKNRQDTKITYDVKIRYANNTNETYSFHGPPGADEYPGPVKWTRPYFDCGRSNKWLVSAVVPIADLYPRHTGFRHIEYPMRGGYQCRCLPGYRLPPNVRRPYLGEIIERSTTEQYYHGGFDCEKISWIHKLPVHWERVPTWMRERYLERYYEYRNMSYGPESLKSSNMNVDAALKFILGLVLNGDVAYGLEEQFANEARMAVRLANFISGFLQVVDPNEVYSGTRVADEPLSEDQMIAETLAVVMGDSRIWSAGTFWDRDKFTNRSLFAPFAYKEQRSTRKFKVEDLARLNKTEEVYLNEPWFQFLKQRWTANFDELEKINMKIRIRFNETGEYNKKYEQYPNFYRAANLDHGYWTQPHFDCKGKVKKWIVTYAAPFFGWDSLRARLEFKGAVACVPLLGRGFETGGYKCECLQGFEYPYEDLFTYFDGQLVEAEFNNIVSDTASRYDTYKCRLSGTCGLQSSLILTVALTLIIVWRAIVRSNF